MSIVRRLINVLRVLLEAHLALARSEAQRDLGRVILASVLIALACTCLATAWLLLHVVVLFALRDSGIYWMPALGGVIGGDVGVAIFCGLIAKNRLSNPMMVESRALMQKTVEGIVG